MHINLMDTLRHWFGPLSQNAIQLDMPPFDPKINRVLFYSRFNAKFDKRNTNVALAWTYK